MRSRMSPCPRRVPGTSDGVSFPRSSPSPTHRIRAMRLPARSLSSPRVRRWFKDTHVVDAICVGLARRALVCARVHPRGRSDPSALAFQYKVAVARTHRTSPRHGSSIDGSEPPSSISRRSTTPILDVKPPSVGRRSLTDRPSGGQTSGVCKAAVVGRGQRVSHC